MSDEIPGVEIQPQRRSFLERYVQAPVAALERAEKLEQLRALAIGGRIRVLQTADTSVGVDTPADVAKVEVLLSGQNA